MRIVLLCFLGVVATLLLGAMRKVTPVYVFSETGIVLQEESAMPVTQITDFAVLQPRDGHDDERLISLSTLYL